MAKASKLSWRIVIDASVARSASEREGQDPTPLQCREILKNVLDICHKAVFTRSVFEEWNRHRSRYAKSWLTQMFGRKKVVILETDEADSVLSEAILGTSENENDVAAMAKDLLLIEAALETDGIIVSRDAAARALFSHASEDVTGLRPLIWVRPGGEGVLAWLAGEREASPEMTLGGTP